MSKTINTLTLPPAKNEWSEYLVKEIDRLIPVLPTERYEQQQFASNIITAANELKVDKISTRSLLIAAFNSARLNLAPGAVLGLCYFVPRWNKNALGKNAGANVVGLEVGYQGFIDLSFSNKHLKSIYADVVLLKEVEDDRFWYGLDNGELIIHHRPEVNRDLNQKTLKERVAAVYCRYETTHGGTSFRVLNRQQLMAVDPTEKKPNDWHYSKQHYYEWARKSAIRRAAKDWKKTREMSWAVHMDDMIEAGKDQEALGDLSNVDATDVKQVEFSLDNLETGEDHDDDSDSK